MPIYTLESRRSLLRLTGQLVMTDTSYVKDLSDPNEENFLTAFTFHQQALANGTKFLVNRVVRQEFIKLVRKSLLVDAILNLSQADPFLLARYRAAAGIPTRPLSPQNLNHNYEKIYKDHVKKGDTEILLNALTKDIWQEVVALEAQAGIAYTSAPAADAVTWDAMGQLMQNTGMSPTDAMIANFALIIGADAIVTTDCDYAPLMDLIDIYMPFTVASQCAGYDAAAD